MSNPANTSTLSIASKRIKQRPIGLSVSEIVLFELSRATACGDCMIAASKLLPSGYSRVHINGKAKRLHRVVLEEKIGRKLLPGEQANHLCNNPACINPDHLYVGSHQDNMNDKVRAGRSTQGTKSKQAKLTEPEVLQMRALHAQGHTIESIGKRFGIHKATARMVIRRITWRHI